MNIAVSGVEVASQELDMANEENRAMRPAAERIAVLVLGMHRSGTSALTRVLNLLGCDLPKTLAISLPSNETGHWESSPIAHLNDQILRSAGSNWHDWLAFNPGWYASPKAAEFKEKALAELEAEFGQSHLFVLKDPRICRFAPFWLDVLATAGVRPAIIMPIRNPLEVAASLAARDDIDPALGHLLWLRHVLEAEAGSRGLTRFHTSYDQLMAAWPNLASGAQDQLGVSWPRLSALTGEEIDAFLIGRLRHHQESPKSVSSNPMLSAWLRQAYAIFGRWAEEGEAAEDHAVLDRIRAELDAAAPAFSRLISAGRQSEQLAKALDANLKEVQGKLADAEAAAATQETQVSELTRHLEETRGALTNSQATAEQKQKEIAEVAGRLAEAQTELANLKTEVQSLRTALEEARGELSHSQSELAQRRAEADDATAQLQETERRLSEELERRAEADAAAAQLRDTERRLSDELESERVRSASRVDEIASLTRLLREKEEEASAALERSRGDKEAAERRLAERFSELAVMTRLLAEKESAVRTSDEQAAWLRQVSAVLLNGSGSSSLKARLAALMPAPVRLNKQKARLKRTGIFDPDAYLAAYPDVAEAGLDPLWHYINHGMAEGRQPHSTQPSKEHKVRHEKN